MLRNKKCSEIYFTQFLKIIIVDEVVVNKMGVDKIGSRQSGNKLFKLPVTGTRMTHGCGTLNGKPMT